MSRFIQADRKTGYLLPPSVEEWLPGDHLARFIVEVVERMDLSALTLQYSRRGSKAHHPATLLSILVYGYATGVFSSRKLERATYDSVAFRYVAANTHPDHDTLANFRCRFMDTLQALFLQVLSIAKEMKLLRFGTVALDGTKIHANASKHSALSYGHIEKLEVHLQAEVAELFAMAAEADTANKPEGLNLPDEIKHREQRLKVMQEAKAKIEARVKERDSKAQQSYEEKLAAREAKQKKTGKKPGGKPPEPPTTGAKPQDQVNLTDEESRIMPVSGGGFEQCYNAQAAVDVETLLVLATGLTQATNDKEQIEPMLATLQTQGQLEQVAQVIADAGYYSEKNIDHCEAVNIEPLFAISRESHHPDWRERYSEPLAQPAEEASAVEKMAYRLKTKAGRAAYALRKQTVEPVFGIIKSVMGFRQFSLRGLKKTTGEWVLVCLAWNMKRLAVLRPKLAKSG